MCIWTASLNAVRRVWRRPQPHIVIKPIGNWLRRLIGNRDAAWNADKNRLQRSDPTVANQFTGKTKVHAGTLLRPKLENDIVAMNRRTKRLPRCKTPSDWFFIIHVLTLPRRFQSDERMPVIRCGNRHSIDVRARAKCSKVMRDLTIIRTIVFINY